MANRITPAVEVKQETRRSDYYSRAMLFVAISLAAALIYDSINVHDEQPDDVYPNGGQLIGIGYVRDLFKFMAAGSHVNLLCNQYVAKTGLNWSQSSLNGCEHHYSWAWTSVDGSDHLPPVSMSLSGKFKVLAKKSREVPNYPLDQQPEPERITHIDADLRTCLGPARAQLGCGACYAFSWNSLLEWHYCKQTGKILNLSEQHIIDCSNFGGFDGCQAGKIEDVKIFAETFGFYLEQDYPYTGRYKEQTLARCRSDEGKRFRAFEWRRLVVDGNEWERVLEEQPILVQAHLPADIMAYKRGIHPADNCNERLLHGMLLVGHGREEGKPYWLVRNSMGDKWGERGHFRLARDNSTMSRCFATGWVGKFKFDSVGSDLYEEFYSQIHYEPTEHVLRRARG